MLISSLLWRSSHSLGQMALDLREGAAMLSGHVPPPSSSTIDTRRFPLVAKDVRWWVPVALLLALALVPRTARGQSIVEVALHPPAAVQPPGRRPWLDRMQHGLYTLVWRSARSIDSLAGRPRGAEEYQAASGSLVLAFLANEYDGFRNPRVRFHVDLPLPRLNERYHLFIGRFNRDEYVSERRDTFGSFPRQDSYFDDETVAGLVYAEPSKQGWRFSGSAGAPIHSGSPDPFVKLSYGYNRNLAERTRLLLKETVFWQRSERWGYTSRITLEKMIWPDWLFSWTLSGTVSKTAEGVRGFSNITATRAFPNRRAVIARLEMDGETGAEVALHEVGAKVAYRQSVFRDWLVLEVRGSLTWPKEAVGEPRKPSWGMGVGCEIYFGNEAFSSHPVTF